MTSHRSEGSAFWRDKRVCVTGGAGFLGSFVVEGLQARGVAEISVPRRSHYNLVSIDAVQQLLNDTRPDIVIHLAGKVGGIGANQEQPAEFFYENLMMGAQLLHESWRAGIEKFVAVGTVCSYPMITTVPFREDDLWDGYPEETNAPHGLAKKMLLVQSAAYRQQYDFNSINLLPTNLYGPRDNFDLETSHVVPALIRKYVEAREHGEQHIVAWGDGSHTREFLYVEDAAEGILLATERYQNSHPVNLGSASEISIKDLANKISGLTGFAGHTVWDTSKPAGQARRSLDTSGAREKFGFQANTPLEQGLRQTIAWYMPHLTTSSADHVAGNAVAP